MQTENSNSENFNGDVARTFVNLLLQNDSAGFSTLAREVALNPRAKDEVRIGLLAIAKADESYEDLRIRTATVDVLGLLGFTVDPDVRQELFDIFSSRFDEKMLEELAAVDKIEKGEICGWQSSEKKFLRSLLGGLLRIPEEPGISAAKLVVRCFSGGPFGKRIAALIEESKNQDS